MLDSFDEWKYTQNILTNGLNAKTIADMNTIPWNNSQIHIPGYYLGYPKETRERYMGMIGKKFGRLTILDVYYGKFRNRLKPYEYIAKCICDCGKEVTRSAHDIYFKQCLSCGCLTRTSNKYEIHGDYTIVYYKDTGFIMDTNVFDYFKYVRIYIKKPPKNELKRIGYPSICVGFNHISIYTALHKLILFAPKGYVVDHINRNTLDCRYSNLRVIPAEENAMNVGIPLSKRSNLPLGVSFTNSGKYIAQATIAGIRYRKIFNTLEEAVAYRKEIDEKYRIYHPIDGERLVLPNGQLNPKYPYEIYPMEFWHSIRINPFIAYRI